ncbi:phototropin-1B-like isoform X2 [Rhododendron vialii]|uniref:phototropin-1B-like isoform X2 n=1 Tax=Rhododendron vialii TaxID=182163 RepID=UPI00265EC066|nr:phototropin-1B-like isoform X2 [Rhododendron vialii]XP_058188175.1 phototropin-1B-like isoform X2 [Rhododendron vialii]
MATALRTATTQLLLQRWVIFLKSSLLFTTTKYYELSIECTKTHVCLITDYCPGGELFLLLDRQPLKVLREDAVRFYAAEVIVGLEYLHCQEC